MQLTNVAATESLGACLAAAIRTISPTHLAIWLSGNLGAGKTTLCRALLRGFGHAGRVPSPTYTLVEPYQCGEFHIFHLDLYRLADAAELEYLGLDEMQSAKTVQLIEWPEHGAGWLPIPDLQIHLRLADLAGDCREARLVDKTATGAAIVEFVENRQSE